MILKCVLYLVVKMKRITLINITENILIQIYNINGIVLLFVVMKTLKRDILDYMKYICVY